MIRVEHIYKKFRKLQVLDDISVQFTKGQVVSLIGPNGSGKTTLIKSILGMVRPDKGEIYFNDQSIRSDYRYRENIGYMPQIGRYPDNMKVGQLFKMLKKFRSAEESSLDTELFETFRLDQIRDKSMRTLSGGTRQKVSAALAFLFNPEVLILDEPTAGLDPVSSEQLKEKITREKNKQKLILITSHILSDLDELTSHVMYIQEGRLQFLKDIQSLRDVTGESRLEKAIARIMKNEGLQTRNDRGGSAVPSSQKEIM
jgi:Cu-processing system ATP-binding protein